MIKYAVQVPFGDEWLYVTTEHPNGEPGHRLVVTHDSEDEAKEAGSQWKQFRIVEFTQQ